MTERARSYRFERRYEKLTRMGSPLSHGRVRAGRAVVAALVALLLVPVTAAAGSRPGVFAGSLGVKVPKGAHATVRAVDAGSGDIVAAKDVGRSGAFTLSLPAGAYVVRGVLLPDGGRATTKTVAVSLRAGQRRRGARLTAGRKAKKKARAAFVTERGNVRPGAVAGGIYKFVGPPGDSDLAWFSRGFHDALISDVVRLADERCPGRAVLREVERMAEILREFELGNSRYADKSTFPRRDLIVLDVAVRGTITEAPGGTARVAITITDDRTGGQLDTIQGTLDLDDVWAGEEEIASRLTDKLCKLTEAYEVTLDVNGSGRFGTHTAAGTMHSVLLARRTGETWTATGPLQWENASFVSKIGCPYISIVVPTIAWSVTIAAAGDQLKVGWSRSGNDGTTASVDCPRDGPDSPDPPPVPGQAGVALLNVAPESFTVPYTGGTAAVSGNVQDGGDGFFNDGTIKVTRKIVPSS